MTRCLAALTAALLLALGATACSGDPSADQIDSPSQEIEEQSLPGGDGAEGEADPQDFEGDTGENEIDGTAPVGESSEG